MLMCQIGIIIIDGEKMKIKCPVTNQIINELQQAGIKCYLVGGYVRDSLLNIQSRDIDIELHNCDIQIAYTIISKIVYAKMVGKFGVIIVAKYNLEFTVARAETKEGMNHTDFDITFITNGDLKLAAKRRDFTINSMMWDLEHNRLIDNYNGQSDLKNRVLRHVSNQFSEDPLRVLRAAKFIARYDLTLDHQTEQLCLAIAADLKHLSTDRIMAEINQVFTCNYNQMAITFLYNILNKLFPLKQCKHKITVNAYGYELYLATFFINFEYSDQVAAFCINKNKLYKDVMFIVNNYNYFINWQTLCASKKLEIISYKPDIINQLVVFDSQIIEDHKLYCNLSAKYNGKYFIDKGIQAKAIRQHKKQKIKEKFNELSS